MYGVMPDDVMTGLVSVDHDLPREYINLAPTTGPVPTIVLERVVEAFAEAEAEAPTTEAPAATDEATPAE